MNNAIQNETMGPGGHVDSDLPDIAALVVGRAAADTQPAHAPYTAAPQVPLGNVGYNESFERPGVSAEAEAAAKTIFPPPGTGHASVAVATDIVLTGGADARWPLSRRLDFALLWRSLELSVAEVARHMKMSERHVRRLRVAFGLETRAALQWLDQSARRNLLPFEEFAEYMTPEGRKLLKIAQARRRINDAARAAKRRRGWRA